MIMHTKLLDYFSICVKNKKAKIRVKVVSIVYNSDLLIMKRQNIL